MTYRKAPRNTSAPHWSSEKLDQITESFDRFVKPLLIALAIISAFISGNGLFSQIINPEFSDLLLCLAIGFALLCISLIFWTGAWHAPELETRFPITIFFVFVVVGFVSYAGVSVTANLSATGGRMAVQLAQEEQTTQLANEVPRAVLYVEQLIVVRDGIATRADLALQSERDEIAGRGPTGIGGAGPVSNSFGAAAQVYRSSAATLTQMLARAETHANELAEVIAEMRSVQIDPEITNDERAARLRVLNGEAIGEIRSLLALDPARTIRSAAATISNGVPPRSQARASSQARIAEISAEMRTFAAELEREADRIAELAPEIPQQVTLSQTEMLFAAAWRMPALTMAAILLDFCGFTALGLRLALYLALKAKIREETDVPVPNYVTLEDFWRVEQFVKRATEARHSIETAKVPSRRGRPRMIGTKPKPSSKSTHPRKSNGGKSND